MEERVEQTALTKGSLERADALTHGLKLGEASVPLPRTLIEREDHLSVANTYSDSAERGRIATNY